MAGFGHAADQAGRVERHLAFVNGTVGTDIDQDRTRIHAAGIGDDTAGDVAWGGLRYPAQIVLQRRVLGLEGERHLVPAQQAGVFGAQLAVLGGEVDDAEQVGGDAPHVGGGLGEGGVEGRQRVGEPHAGVGRERRVGAADQHGEEAGGEEERHTEFGKRLAGLDGKPKQDGRPSRSAMVGDNGAPN